MVVAFLLFFAGVSPLELPAPDAGRFGCFVAVADVGVDPEPPPAPAANDVLSGVGACELAGVELSDAGVAASC